jgi:uncharacterized alkaline shock family protein YloU
MVESEERIAENTAEINGLGTVKIASDVVATIAGLAAADVSGIAGMSGGMVGGIAEMLGRKSLTKGVKVEITEQNTTIDILCIVEYGVAIAEVAKEVQLRVKGAVESMTGLSCQVVNVHIQGVTFPEGHPNSQRPSVEE